MRVIFEETNTVLANESLRLTWITDYLISNFQGLKLVDTWGEKSFFYNPDNLLKHGIYFCTIKEKNGENDLASDLNRAGVFRVSFGVSKETFLTIFKTVSKRPTKGNCIEGIYDFTALDSLTPHPIYGWMSWVSILNPSRHSWCAIEPLLWESYKLRIKKYTDLTIFKK